MAFCAGVNGFAGVLISAFFSVCVSDKYFFVVILNYFALFALDKIIREVSLPKLIVFVYKLGVECNGSAYFIRFCLFGAYDGIIVVTLGNKNKLVTLFGSGFALGRCDLLGV